ncbi:MAG: response regulator [Endomicrobiales bacterium]|nr:response regulator [Endomicrobiales bacterium]
MSRKRIMVVDNEDKICDIYKRVLVNEGYEVEACYDGDEAVQKVSENQYDLVITDIKMPKMSGFNVIKKTKELSPDTDVIVISGYATIDAVVKTVRMGAQDYIIKPFEICDLVTKVKKCLEKENFV